jgi:hypothetical protein
MNRNQLLLFHYLSAESQLSCSISTILGKRAAIHQENSFMHPVRTFTFILLAILVTQTTPAQPQESLPAGPYQQTCSDVSVKNGNLYAKCRDNKGKTYSARLSHFEKCGSEIVNKNGSLECSHAGTNVAPALGSQEPGLPDHAAGARSGIELPPGPYTETCKNVRMRGTTLHAVCRSLDGREMPVSLKDADRCSQGVVNMNGILNCAVADVIPPGSYLATCKEIRLQGTTLRAFCDNGQGKSVATDLRDANKCSGDISNYRGRLHCSPVKHMERR